MPRWRPVPAFPRVKVAAVSVGLPFTQCLPFTREKPSPRRPFRADFTL